MRELSAPESSPELPNASPSPLARLAASLGSPVDAGALAYFRIVFGLVLAWEAYRYMSFGWVDKYYVDRPFLFGYWPFEFVKPWSADGLRVHFVVLVVAGLLVSAGLFYRLATVVAFLGVTYMFLLDKSLYLNHIYLVCLVAFVMMFLPAHRRWSVDALRSPEIASEVVPAWMLWLVRFQIALPYVFGGISKLNPDWFQGEPLKMWLADQTDFPLIGHMFVQDPVPRLMTFGALVLDLGVVPLLLFRKTRPFGYAAAVLFHFLNARLFNIGIFPWFMIVATVIFFPPDWPRRVSRDLWRRPESLRSVAWWTGFVGGAWLAWFLPKRFEVPPVVLGGLGCALVLYSLVELFRPLPDDREPGGGTVEAASLPVKRTDRLTRPVSVLLALWVALHLLVPLRHLAIPGNTYWTEEGHRFSWMMLVRSKVGTTRYVITDRSSGATWQVNPAVYLAPHQLQGMRGKPDMVLEFAHYLRDRLHEEGRSDVEVRALTSVSLNGREWRPMVDPEVDLATVRWPWFGHADWILPDR